MAGYGAALGKKENEGVRGDVYDLIPEGVEATVPYRGPVKTIIHQLAGGIARFLLGFFCFLKLTVGYLIVDTTVLLVYVGMASSSE